MLSRPWRALVLSCFSTLFGCGGSSAHTGAGGDATPKQAKSSLTRDTADASAASSGAASANAFAVDLYTRVAAGAPAGANVITSPMSASLALGMAYAGAAGTTALQLAAALRADPSASSAFFDGQNALSQTLAGRGASAYAGASPEGGPDGGAPVASEYQLQIVNSLWAEQSFTWKQPFLDRLATSYGAGVYLSDFVRAPEATRVAINGWVSDATAGKINDLLPAGAIDPSTPAVLVNAIHLAFPWATPFDDNGTTAGTFTRGDGTTATTDFMGNVQSLPYVDDGQAQIFALPLAGQQIYVVLGLPHAGVDLAAYQAALTAHSAALTVPTTSAEVEFTVPRMDITTATFSLKAALMAMGMTDAFDGTKADFSPMTSTTAIWIDDVRQKAMLSFTPRGVEAAAATSVVFRDASAVLKTVTVKLDHPFHVAIVDGPTGAVLFVGRIADPTASGAP